MKTSDFILICRKELIARIHLNTVPLPTAGYLTEKAERRTIAFSVISVNI